MGRTIRVRLRYCRYVMLSEKLLRPQVPQPIDSENGSPLSNDPPVAIAWAWLTITRATGKCKPRSRICASSLPW